MSFTPLPPFQNSQNAILNQFGIPATLFPASLNNASNPIGTGIAISGVPTKEPLLEQLAPGGSKPTAIVYFWVQWWNIDPNPATGDIIEINGGFYDVANVKVDRQGAATLHLSINSQFGSGDQTFDELEFQEDAFQ